MKTAIRKPRRASERTLVTPFASERQAAFLLENLVDHFVQYDREWRYTFVTAKGAAFIGKTPDELLGRSIWDVFPDAVGNRYYQELHRSVREDKIVRFEHYYAPFDKWFDNHIYPDATGVTVFSADVTERKRAELALNAAQGRHQTLLELVPAGVCYCSAPDGRLQYFNRRATELWGYEPVLGGGDRGFEPERMLTASGEPIPQHRSPIASALQGHPVRDAKVVIERRDGVRITLLNSADPVRDDDGRVVGALSVFQDITSRKLAEAKVQQARQEMLDFVEHAAEGMHWLDADGVITWANRAELDLLGYRREEYVGRPITEFHNDPRAIQAILQRLRGGEVLNEYEATLRCKDGSLKQVSVNSSVLFDNGRFVHTCCFTRDITDRKRAEETRGLLAAIVESSNDAIVGKTLDGIITSWNGAAERLLGYPHAEIIGKSVWTIVPDDRIVEEEALLARIRGGERVEQYETVRRHRSGAPIEVSVTLSPIRDSLGVIVGVSSVSHEIGGRKKAEREIRDREERYRSLVDASGAIVYTSDADSRWTERNLAWEAYTGQAYPEYLGYGWWKALHPDDMPPLQASVAGAHAGKTAWHAEARLWHAATQAYRHQEARAVPIMAPDGSVRAWVGTCADVHARKVAENAVREADRRKDDFLAVLAHELRNPLAPISTGMQILRMPSAADPSRGATLDVMDRQIRHLVRLVDDLMEVARINRGSIELKKEILRLQDVARGALEIGRDLVESMGHRLHVEMPDAALPVHGDSVRLTQIVANLLNNAARYTPRNGDIKLSCEAVGDEAVVRVEDNGLGIAPDMIDRVFDLFAQGGRSRVSGGLGVGLMLSRRLAEMHGGCLEGYSRGEGQGSQFTLRLPLCQQVPRPAVALEMLVPSTVRRRVLVVDDNRDAATSLATLLDALGQDVRFVNDGVEALRVIEQMRPDVVLLDLGMPTLDGFAVAHELRAAPWGKTVQLIAVTGWGQESDRHRTEQAGFDLHLVKPVDLPALRKAMGI